MLKITANLNGQKIAAEVEARTLLVDFIRHDLQLTGTHVGCDTSQCGACVIHINGKSVKACAMLAVEIDGCDVTTIEGIGNDDPSRNDKETHDKMSDLQQAFKQYHGLQCGFCTPGMIMSASDLIARKPDASDSEIRHWLEGNICRCTGYQNIIRAVSSVTTRGDTQE